MRFLTGFAQIASDYDGFVLDLWGVIHDGVNAFPYAVDCLVHLRDAGKRTLLLTNASRYCTCRRHHNKYLCVLASESNTVLPLNLIITH